MAIYGQIANKENIEQVLLQLIVCLSIWMVTGTSTLAAPILSEFKTRICKRVVSSENVPWTTLEGAFLKCDSMLEKKALPRVTSGQFENIWRN